MNDGTNPADSASTNGIVSVNARGARTASTSAKVVFVAMVVAMIAVIGLFGWNKWRAAQKANAALTAEKDTTENKPAMIGSKRVFSGDAKGAAVAPAASVASGNDRRGLKGLMSEAARPEAGASGAGQGGVIVPPIPTAGGARGAVASMLDPAGGGAAQNDAGAASHGRTTSRYGGDAIIGRGPLGGAASALAGTLGVPDPPPQVAKALDTLQMLAKQQMGAGASGLLMGGPSSSPAPGAELSEGGGRARSLGANLAATKTERASAGTMGQRLMVPKGRSIDCALTMRLISDVSGLASCVLSSNVYSADGSVVLLERGSEAEGEYGSTMLQGQKRLFVVWTRIRTPKGVTIELNSPAADELGTSGLPGYVDNHWWERIGAAFMLSIVQDAIAFTVAHEGGKASGSLGTTTTGSPLDNTQTTSNRIAEQVLSNSINIKPTLYKNQGERGSIYVARDLDFSTVYELRAE